MIADASVFLISSVESWRNPGFLLFLSENSLMAEPSKSNQPVLSQGIWNEASINQIILVHTALRYLFDSSCACQQNHLSPITLNKVVLLGLSQHIGATSSYPNAFLITFRLPEARSKILAFFSFKTLIASTIWLAQKYQKQAHLGLLRSWLRSGNLHSLPFCSQHWLLVNVFGFSRGVSYCFVFELLNFNTYSFFSLSSKELF